MPYQIRCKGRWSVADGKALCEDKFEHYGEYGDQTPRYQQGKPTLSIAYNGIGNEFVFTLDQHGKVDTKFNVDVQHILTIMGVPLSVSPI